MDSIKLLLFALTILGYKSYCQGCEREYVLSDLSGRINTPEIYTCWKIQVPSHNFIRISVSLENPYNNGYHYCNVVITVVESGTEYKICNQPNQELPIIYGNVTVEGYSEFIYTVEYKIQNVECLNNNSFQCSNHTCIPEYQVCNGEENCENGADEIGCETGIKAIKGISKARNLALSWLKGTRTPSWGWKENTPRSVVALYLASGASFDGTNLEEELIAKETELKISVALLRPSLSNSQLSMFLNSLLVLCQNPRHFFGNNLVKRLKDQVEKTKNFTHPVAYLALCNANETLPQKAIDDLGSILSSESDYPFVRDIQAMAVMALSCDKDKDQNKSLLNSTFQLYRGTIERFKGFQQKDGSFGNAYTTAMIVQALISSGEEYSEDWNLGAAAEFLMKHLNSSSIDFLSTYLTLPLLNGKTLTDVAKVNCSLNLRKHDVSEISDYIGPKIRVQYSLFIGDDKDVTHTISLLVPTNYTAFEVMELAEVENIKYRFKENTVSGTIYVYEIANITNDLEAGKFWLLYLGNMKGKSPFKHLTTSIDQLVMKDGDHLIMWYKTAGI